MEDELLVAMEIEDALRDNGAEIEGPFVSVRDGLTRIENCPVDAAILDIALADGDVFPIAERLHAQSTPFVFHTAHGDRETLKQRFGGVVVCSKPTKASELVGELAKAVA